MIHLILTNVAPYDITGMYEIMRVQGIVGTDRLQVVRLRDREDDTYLMRDDTVTTTPSTGVQLAKPGPAARSENDVVPNYF